MIAALALMLAVIPPAPTHFVTDGSHALSADAAAHLETELHDFQTATGHQVIVWIGQSTDGEALENFTVDAAQKWKVGRKGKDDGAVLFVFMRDHRVRIEVGYGLESRLTDAKSANIISNIITPRMRSGDADGAISVGVDEMLAAIDPTRVAPSAEPTSASTDDSDDTAGAIVFVLLTLIIGGGLLTGIIVTIARRGKRKGDWLDAFMFVNPPGYSGTGGHFMGGGGFGGGGFSGGGGGFGGGGASGGW